jgi:hypothetical protein
MKRDGKATLGLLTGIAVGSGLMYLADPDRGNRRWALVRAKFIHGAHESEPPPTGVSRPAKPHTRIE